MFTLPTPDLLAQARSAQLVQHIRECIHAAGGRISFADYMQLALYTPGLGYYMAGAQQIGASGDFITAPLVSPLFAQCLAQQSAALLTELGDDALILEFGAGTGQLAHDLLLALDARDKLPAAYWILEPSATLQQCQHHTLHALPESIAQRVRWLERLPAAPFKGIILANEVLDAMPVQRFRYSEGVVEEAYVSAPQQALTLTFAAPSSVGLAAAVAQLPLPRTAQGYVSEINLALHAWLRSVGDCLTQGVALLIDYGFPSHEYYHAQRTQGTLLCYYQHRVHDDPLFYPGLQDMTAHVDFSAVAHAASAAQWTLAGYTTQALFLLATGLTDVPPMDDCQAQLLRSQQIRKLTCPSEMGELCKVMALSKHMTQALQGFALRDMRDRL